MFEPGAWYFEAFVCSLLTRPTYPWAMARFRVAGSPKAKAAVGVPEANEAAISAVVGGNMPLGRVTVRGRVVALFPNSDKYPCRKHLEWNDGWMGDGRSRSGRDRRLCSGIEACGVG